MSDHLPVGVLLGKDVFQLLELLTQQNSEISEPEKAMIIITRAAVQKLKEQKTEEKRERTRGEMQSGIEHINEREAEN